MTTATALELIRGGMFGYGFTITRAGILALENHTEPDYHILEGYEAVQEAKKYDLLVLGIYSSINEQLLSLGRTLKQINGDYSVPGINQTFKYVKLYDDKANRSMLRSRKLRESFQRINPGMEQTHEERNATALAHRLETNQNNIGR